MTRDELITYLFDGAPHLLLEPLAGWLSSSRRFAAFVTDVRTKIRKKLRTTQDREGLLDLRLELETAFLLLQERSLGVAYEPGLPTRARGPDFAVTFTTSLTFMLEVTRVRGSARIPLVARLADVVPAKLGQLRPRHGNVVLIGVEARELTPSDLHAAMLGIQRRAEQNDVALVQRQGYRDPADFFRHYRHLTEVLVRGVELDESGPLAAWVNPQARVPLPRRVRTALHRCLAGP